MKSIGRFFLNFGGSLFIGCVIGVSLSLFLDVFADAVTRPGKDVRQSVEALTNKVDKLANLIEEMKATRK